MALGYFPRNTAYMRHSAFSVNRTSCQIPVAIQISAFHHGNYQWRSAYFVSSVLYYAHAALMLFASAVFHRLFYFLPYRTVQTGLLIFPDSTVRSYADSWLSSAESINISISSRFYKIWIFSFFCVFHINHLPFYSNTFLLLLFWLLQLLFLYRNILNVLFYNSRLSWLCISHFHF